MVHFAIHVVIIQSWLKKLPFKTFFYTNIAWFYFKSGKNIGCLFPVAAAFSSRWFEGGETQSPTWQCWAEQQICCKYTAGISSMDKSNKSHSLQQTWSSCCILPPLFFPSLFDLGLYTRFQMNRTGWFIACKTYTSSIGIQKTHTECTFTLFYRHLLPHALMKLSNQHSNYSLQHINVYIWITVLQAPQGDSGLSWTALEISSYVTRIYLYPTL